MTQIIAFITPSIPGRHGKLSSLASELKLAVTAGAECISPDVRAGLLSFKDSECPNGLIFTIGTIEDASDAWTLHQELIDSRSTSIEPRLLNFLGRLNDLLRTDQDTSYFLAADEWTQADDVLFFSGCVDELVSFLLLNRSLNLYFWRLGTHGVHGTPRYPLAFEIIPEKTVGSAAR